MAITGTGVGVPEAKHVLAAAGASALSLVIHAAVVLLAPEIRLDVPEMSRAIERRRQRHFEVSRLDTEPVASAAMPEILRPAESDVALDTTRAVEEMERPPDAGEMEPRTVKDYRPVGDAGSMAGPAVDHGDWQPRHEIIAIARPVVEDRVAAIPRRKIPRIERVSDAPDIVVPYDAARAVDALDSEDPRLAPGAPPRRATPEAVARGGRSGPAPLDIGEMAADSGTEVFVETPPEVTSLSPIEDLLAAGVRTYTSFRDRRFGYFRMDIGRAGAEALPVMPKDVVLIQDTSASMTEQKLRFCREGLLRCVAALGPEDRFNVVSFRDKATFCFDAWAENTLESLNTAAQFLQNLKAGGNTDIFSSVRDLVKLPRSRGRPVVAMLVTDGQPTAGMTDSSNIIAEFSKLNEGRISVFALGTVQTANSYLLDLLSYCNRGDSHVVARGRWDIPDVLQTRMIGISRPVLSNVRFVFADDSLCEVYPVQTSNLYLDRPLVLYGRYRRESKNLVFQAVGAAYDAKCDMIFSVPLTGTRRGEADIREMWAKQKIYHLIAENARRTTPDILREIRETASHYNVRIPHRGRF